MRLSGKIAAITGGGGGIGKAAAQTFAKEGAVVLILEKDETLGKETEAEIIDAGGKAEFFALDISNW